MASCPSEEEPSSQGSNSKKDHKAEQVPESSSADSLQASELTTVSSVLTTASSTSTQDSGFSSSQDLLESQELVDELAIEPCVMERTLSQASTSKEPSWTEEQTLKDTVLPKMLSSKKRKSSSGEDCTDSKRLKSVEDKDEVSFRDAETQTNNDMASSPDKAWLSSPDGAKFIRTPSYQEWLTKKINEETSASTSGSTTGVSMLCTICCLRPKNASIIHGRLSHQATCYQCARRLLKDGARCPVCRRKIHMVCKHILV